MTFASISTLALSMSLTAGCAGTGRPAVTAQVHGEPVLVGSEASAPALSQRVTPVGATPSPQALRRYYLLAPGPNATLVVTRAE